MVTINEESHCQARVASQSLEENAERCRMREVEIQTRKAFLDRSLEALRAEVAAQFLSAQIPKPPKVADLHRHFMEMAVEEARKCKPEDGRVHPLVGVVVSKDGKVQAQSHRGETGPGEHAEYIALEKKLRDISTAGATVYTTLEPCTTRNLPKVPCAKRVIERKIKKVVVGMLDPDVRVKGNGILLLRDAGIEIELFPSDLMTQIEELNREFSRSRRAAPAPTEHDAHIEMRSQWQQNTDQGKPGYDLHLVNKGKKSVEIGTLALEQPVGFGINKGGKSGGWHQDPSFAKPRIVLEESVHPEGSVYIGRLCMFELNSRLASRTGQVKWRVTGRDIPPVEGTTEVDLERMLPPQSRAALSTSREIDFKLIASLSDLSYSVGGAGGNPTLLEDTDLGHRVLKGPNPAGDSPLDIPFDPPIPFSDISTLSIRMRAKPTRYFMFHVGLSTPSRTDPLFITFKPEAGDPRSLSDHEWIVPLGSGFFRDGWFVFERNVRLDSENFFQARGITATGIALLKIRGDYSLDSIVFRA